MSYLLSEYRNLTVSYHKRGTNFGYHFCVQSNCTNTWACKTKWEFKRWLKNRGLTLDKKDKHFLYRGFKWHCVDFVDG